MKLLASDLSGSVLHLLDALRLKSTVDFLAL